MTTTTRRPLRVFTCAETVDFLPSHIYTALGGPSHDAQGVYYVVAASKAAAARRLIAAGWSSLTTPRELRVAPGSIHELAVRDAGMLDADGAIVAFRSARTGDLVVAVDGTADVTVVGQWNYVDRTGAANAPDRGATWLTRLADGARFPERYSSTPATPAVGWDAAQAVTR